MQWVVCVSGYACGQQTLILSLPCTMYILCTQVRCTWLHSVSFPTSTTAPDRVRIARAYSVTDRTSPWHKGMWLCCSLSTAANTFIIVSSFLAFKTTWSTCYLKARVWSNHAPRYFIAGDLSTTSNTDSWLVLVCWQYNHILFILFIQSEPCHKCLQASRLRDEGGHCPMLMIS